MAKLIVTEFMSLDGVIENPMWTFKYWNDEIAKFKGEETSNDEALLLGRVTYEGFAQAWPQRTDVESGGVYFNGARKYVVSSTLEKAEWNNSQIIKDNVFEEIAKLKQGSQDLVVHGSAKLAQSLIQNNLVDVYRFIVYPIVLGSGQRLFNDETKATLTLVEARPFSSGAVGLIYQPA